MATEITDLPVDALSNILASVATLPDVAADIAKSISVCKRFLEASKSNIVYKVVSFQKVQVDTRHHLFQRTVGLLYSCASAGNLSAQFLLAQVLLGSSTQLVHCGIKSTRLRNFREYCMRYNTGNMKFQDGYLVASFMAKFIPARGFRPFLSHWELVKVFLSNCTSEGIFDMCRHISRYIEYFSGPIPYGNTGLVFMCSVYSMRHVISEEMRVKALLDFDRVSRVFPGFVVLNQKK